MNNDNRDRLLGVLNEHRGLCISQFEKCIIGGCKR